MSLDRTAEIWSTRLQRELVALTEAQKQKDKDNGKEESSENQDAEKEEGAKTETKKLKANLDIAMLPDFINVKDHVLTIDEGVCTVTFEVSVCPPPPTKKEPDAAETQTDSAEEKPDETKDTEDQKEEKAEVSEESTSPGTVVLDMPTYVLITLVASMERNAQNQPIADPNTYPFQKPKALLSAGEELFPENSDLKVGDYIDIDCDWTPSLHLADAALNVALKIRESIRKGYPLRKAENSDANAAAAVASDEGESVMSRMFAALPAIRAPSILLSEAPAVEEQETPHQHPGIIKIGDDINLQDEPFASCVGMYPSKPIRRPDFMEVEIRQATARNEQASSTAASNDDDEDENEIPEGLGNYMMLQAGGIRKVAGAGIMGAGSIFKSIVKSTKTALEESYLMITDDFVIELKASKLSVGAATVTYIIPISLLSKLKFRRNESLSLFFKQAPDDPYVLMCPDSFDAVQQIQSMLKRYGVKGKHTTTATQRLVQEALKLVHDVQAKEQAIENDDSNLTLDNVNEIMSLYRQAAELFENANDPRHNDVMKHMHDFLAKPIVASLLESGKSTDASSDNATNAKPKDKTDDIMKEAEAIFAQADNDLETGDAETSNIDTSEIDAMLSAADKELEEMIKS